MKTLNFKPSLFSLLLTITLLGSVSLHAEEPDLSDTPSDSGVVVQVEEVTIQPEANAFKANYRKGSAPFSEKTKVKISKSGDTLVFAPHKGEAWSLHLKKVRGAIEGKTGFWFYWFDANNNTLNGFFRMKDNIAELVGMINTSVNDYFQQPMRAQQRYRSDFESYKEKALKEAQ